MDEQQIYSIPTTFCHLSQIDNNDQWVLSCILITHHSIDIHDSFIIILFLRTSIHKKSMIMHDFPLNSMSVETGGCFSSEGAKGS